MPSDEQTRNPRTSRGVNGQTRPVPVRVRLVLCVLAGLLAAHFTYWVATHVAFHRDFGHLWYATRELLHGRDPYAAVGPGRAFDWPWPLYYPVPSLIASIPLAPLPEAIAVSVLAG